MPSKKRGQNSEREELLRLAVLPLKEIMREYGSEYPEAVGIWKSFKFLDPCLSADGRGSGNQGRIFSGEHDDRTTATLINQHPTVATILMVIGGLQLFLKR